MSETFVKLEVRCNGCTGNCGLDAIKKAVELGASLNDAVEGTRGEFGFEQGDKIVFCRNKMPALPLGMLIVIENYARVKAAATESVVEKLKGKRFRLP